VVQNSKHLYTVSFVSKIVAIKLETFRSDLPCVYLSFCQFFFFAVSKDIVLHRIPNFLYAAVTIFATAIYMLFLAHAPILRICRGDMRKWFY